MGIIAEKNEFGNIKILTETGEVLLDVAENGRERPWKQHKMNNEKITELFQKALRVEPTIITNKGLERLADCASTVVFARDAEQRLRLERANFCRARLCPMCNWRKSLKLFSQMSKIAAVFLAQRQSARFLFVTLTVPNCTADDLGKTINSMNKAFAYLTSPNQTFALAKKFKANLLGYMRAIEVTYNQQSDSYHPHIHCLFGVKAQYFTNGYIKKSEWQHIWTKAIKSDMELIVHVETVKNTTAKAVAEIAKYPTKSTDLFKIKDEKQCIAALIVLQKTLRNRRLTTFGGEFLKIKQQLGLDDVDSDEADLIHVDDESETFQPIERVLYKWHIRVGAYIC